MIGYCYILTSAPTFYFDLIDYVYPHHPLTNKMYSKQNDINPGKDQGGSNLFSIVPFDPIFINDRV